MDKITVAVLFGGCSTEYEISLQSAASVIENLSPDKYEPVLIGITRTGQWLKYGGGVERISDGTWTEDVSCVPAVISPDRETHGVLVFDGGVIHTIRLDAAFPVLHGKNGEDGTVQGLLELAGIPIVGCGTLCSAICMDKDIAHQLAGLAGIKTPACVVFRSKEYDPSLLEQAAGLTFPLFVKPVNSGSSFGVTKIDGPGELKAAVDNAFEYDRKVIAEEAIGGFEVGCAVLGNETLIIGQVDEIELSQGFFDYTEKYTLKTSKIHMPARIDAALADTIRETAGVIYRILGCEGLARIDLFLTPEHDIVFNEANTIPGFTSHSRYPSMLKGVGMSFEQIVDELIRLAVRG